MTILLRRRTQITIIFLILLMTVDPILVYIRTLGAAVPWVANFLTSTSEGHIPQMILWFLLPLFTLTLVSDIGIEGKCTNLFQAKLIRNKNIILKEALFVFGFTMLVFIIIFLYNTVLTEIIFAGGTFDFDKMEVIGNGGLQGFLNPGWQYDNIYLTLGIYMLLSSLFASITALVSYFLGFILNKRSELYIVSFVIYFLLNIILTLTRIVQPFTELPIAIMGKSLISYIIISVLIIIISYVLTMKRDVV